jgi:hypothetical protein
MLLLPAAKAGAPLEIDAPLDSRLHEAAPRILAIARDFWGLEGTSVRPREVVTRAPSGGGAMFFTGGVDSFHTLQRCRERIERLIYVHGFDVSLDDVARYAGARAWIKQVAAATGLKTVFPRTNLRPSHPFATLSWEATHVAALAAVAHALSPVVARVHVASSDVPPPWGSQPELDRLWSSGAVEVVNDGAECSRLDKVRAIADWDLVHRFLRVCWEKKSSAANCGICEKCVRTQAQFAAAGTLRRLTTFPRGSLVERIDALPHAHDSLVGQWRDIREAVDDRAVAAAIDRYLARKMTPTEWLQHRTDWIKRWPAGRLLRRIGKRLLQS